MIMVETAKHLNIGAIIGAILAMIISWERNKSIFWAVIHGFFNWLYVIYYYFFLKAEN